MSTLLAQGTGTVTVGVEVFSGSYDGQGKPSYGTSSDISAQYELADRLVRSRDGSEVVTSLTLWVDAGESVQPAHRDRVTLSGETYIVVERKAVRDLQGTLDHTRLRCREE